MEERVNSRIPADIKARAGQVLADHGLSISTFIRLALTSVAKEGLPVNWGIPNSDSMASILEMADDLNDPRLPGMTTVDELEAALNE